MATARPPRRRRAAKPAEAPDQAFHPVPTVAQRPPRRSASEQAPRPGRFPKEAVVWTVLLGLGSFATGWLTADNRLIPGVFLASDIGLFALFSLTLRGLGRVVRSRIHADGIAEPSAALPKAAAWSLGVYWFFATLTNVLQLAIGLGLGIIGYQLFASKSRIARDGYGHATRFGPAFAPTLGVLGAYFVWSLARLVAGPVPGFDVASLVFGLAVMTFAFVATDRAARDMVGTPRRAPRAHPAGHRRSDIEKRVIAGTIGGYLFFRFFISSAIPYGPIVEWLLVCVGALFIAIVIADRIGVVPTRRALPGPDARVHVQRILSLPDRSLEETDERIAGFIRSGDHGDWVAARFRDLYLEAGIPSREIEKHLAPFRLPDGRRGRYPPVATYGLEARQDLVHRLIRILQEKRQNGTTGTLKTDPVVQKEATGPRPLVVPTT